VRHARDAHGGEVRAEILLAFAMNESIRGIEHAKAGAVSFAIDHT
jgi:hypothetical protein